MEDMFSRSTLVVHILFLILSDGFAEVTNFGMCKDPDCSDPVGYGETTLSYTAPDKDKISFGIGYQVKIFSRDAGPKKDLLGVEIQGKRGYAPKHMVRETVSYIKNKTLVPAKSKFGAPLSTPGSVGDKPYKVSHSSSVDKHVLPSNPPVDDSIPVSSSSDESVPSATPSDESLPSAIHSDKSAPSAIPSDKSVPSAIPSDKPVPSAIPSDKSVPSAIPSDKSVPSAIASKKSEPVLSSSNSSVDESAPSPSMSGDKSGQNDQEASNVELSAHSGSTSGENVVTKSQQEDKKPSVEEMPATDSKESDKSHSSEASSVDISTSDAVPDNSVSVDSITHSSHSDFKTSDGMDATTVTDVQHSSNYLGDSDHPASSTKDAVSDISPTSAENVDSYSTEHFEQKRSDSAAAHTDLNSSMPSDTVLLSLTEDKGLETMSEELLNARTQVTESLPQVVDGIVQSVSTGSLKLDKDAVQQGTQSPLQETHKKETVAVTDEIEATMSFLAKRGINVSDIAADNDADTESLPEAQSNTESQSVDLHNDLHPQNSHKTLHRKLPLVDSLKEGLKILEKKVKQDIPESDELLLKGTQQHSSEKNVNSGGDSLSEISEEDTEVFSKDSISMKTQESVLTKTEYTAPDTYNQHLHGLDKQSDIDGDFPMASSQGSRLHTSFNSESYEKGHASVGYPPVPDHKFGNVQHDLGTSVENGKVHFTNTENIYSESSVSNTEDFNEAKVQSESHVTAKSPEDYSSSVTEATFVSRHLKSEVESDDPREDSQYEKQDVSSDSSSFSSFSVSEMFSNSIEGLRSFIEVVTLWLPEPLQLYLLDLQSKGVPPRAVVFTALIAMPTIFLIITVIYIRQSSKENSLLVKLSGAEQKLFLATTERDVLKEDIGKLKSQITTLQSDFEQEQKSAFIFKKKLEKSENLSQSSSTELRAQLKDLENQLEMKTESVSALQTALEQCKETNGLLQRKLQEEENAVSTITVQLQEFEEEVRTLQKEKEDFVQSEANYKEKIVELEQSCNQLLEEAQAWNSRVNELTTQLQSETSSREELENSVQSKDSEIQSLQNAVMNLQIIQDLKNSGDADENTFEEKMKQMLDASVVEIKLKKAEDERDAILKSFESERKRVMELEVEVVEAKSEIEKLKSNYNQALQDKTEAQTKLEVLSNYFKDKEMQLQKELGVQEAVRQQKEEDASFAARRVHLIEEENASYKYQVATLKQEIEETERNYKNQVALQEKKAHENWLAARAAERKLEDVKQESAQLRQRLTLLEREQENWLNSSRDEIVRPVPKRPGGPNGEIGAQEINRSKDSSSGSLPLPPEMLPPLRPPVLPLDRPLPPPGRMSMMEPPRGFPPPPMDPYFDFGPPPMPFPPQPWHARLPHPLDRRTPSSYERGRLTPPASRRHQSPTISDKEIGRRSASPKEISSRGSHTSSPPHPLPHFHDIPPPPGSYDFRHGLPPPLNSRYPLPPPPRREFLNQGPGLTRADSRNSDMITSTPRGTHQLPPAQDRKHQQPSSRV